MTNNDNKTKPTSRDVLDFIASLPEKQQVDAEVLVSMMSEVSGEKPVIWGSRIVGFGSYHYISKSGREGDWARIGFAPGSGKFSLYLTYDAERLTNQFKGLGKFTTGKGCIYINKLADVDLDVLKRMVAYANKMEDIEVNS